MYGFIFSFGGMIEKEESPKASLSARPKTTVSSFHGKR
jgi:hypothetical protein